MNDAKPLSCGTAVEHILDSTVQELESPGPSLAAHLAGCSTCDRKVENVLSGLRELEGWLDRPASEGAILRVLSDAAARPMEHGVVTGEGSLSMAAEAVSRPRGRRPIGRMKRGAQWAVPLALAAGLATVSLLPSMRDSTTPTDRLVAPTAFVPRSVPVLTIRGDRDAVIFATRDPNITVVWFLGGD